jgi:DUF1680 family protein
MSDIMKQCGTRIISAGILPIVFQLAPSTIAADYPLRPAPVGSVKVDGGFWGPRVTTNATVTVPHNFKFLEETPRMAIFDLAAGVTPKKDIGDSYVGDSDVFKIIEGAAYSLQLRPDQIDGKHVARQVARVLAAREEDGFLCPRVTLKNPDSRWDGLRKSHVLYNAPATCSKGAWRGIKRPATTTCSMPRRATRT